MNETPSQITCEKCLMGFRVEEPAALSKGEARCPQCNRVFWERAFQSADGSRQLCRVGIRPERLSEWRRAYAD